MDVAVAPALDPTAAAQSVLRCARWNEAESSPLVRPATPAEPRCRRTLPAVPGVPLRLKNMRRTAPQIRGAQAWVAPPAPATSEPHPDGNYLRRHPPPSFRPESRGAGGESGSERLERSLASTRRRGVAVCCTSARTPAAT